MRSTNKVLFWIAASLLFSVVMFSQFGPLTGTKYLATYAIEMLLSFDNLLMFYVIFKFFGLSEQEQAKALRIGIISAFAMRFIMIFGGSILLQQFHWLSYGFGAFLIWSAYKMLKGGDEDDDAPIKVINFFQTHTPLSKLGVVIGVIEVTDIMFALDSVPASFGITWNPLIIYSANLFAIMGLRAMYFVMLELIENFSWLEKVIAIILMGVGFSMFFGS